MGWGLVSPSGDLASGCEEELGSPRRSSHGEGSGPENAAVLRATGQGKGFLNL